MKRGALEHRFLELLKERLDRGEKPSTRAIFKVLIEEGVSKRLWGSVSAYGPGAKWSKLRNEAVIEYKAWKERAEYKAWKERSG